MPGIAVRAGELDRTGTVRCLNQHHNDPFVNNQSGPAESPTVAQSPAVAVLRDGRNVHCGPLAGLTAEAYARRLTALYTVAPEGSDAAAETPQDTEIAAPKDYMALLKQALWRPTELELFVMDRDGSNTRQVTKLGGEVRCTLPLAGTFQSRAIFTAYSSVVTG
mgnify:CR=1 FL=1